jgi:hypothetical protein
VDSAGYTDTDFGPGVYTRGDVRAQGALSISGESHLYDDVYQYSNVYTSGKTDISGALFVNGDILTNGQVRNCNELTELGPASTITLYTGNGPMFGITPGWGQLNNRVNVYCYSGFTGTTGCKPGETLYVKVQGTAANAASTIVFKSDTFYTTGSVASNSNPTLISFVQIQGTMTEISRAGPLDNSPS